MKTYWRILSYAKPIGAYVIPYSLLTFLAIGFGLLNYSFLMPALDILFDQELSPVGNNEQTQFVRRWMESFTYNQINRFGKEGALVVVCLIIALSNFSSNFFKYFSLRIINKIRADVVRKIRHHLFSKITQLPIGYFSNERKGGLMSRIMNDVQEVENSVVSSMTVVFRDPVTIIVYFVVLFYISWKLMLITLIMLPISGILISTINKKLKRQSHEGQESLANLSSIIDEALSGMKVIYAFNATRYVLNKFSKENKNYASILKRMSDRRESASPLSEFMGVSVIALLLYFGGKMVFSGEMKGSEFIFFVASFYQILVPAKAISASISNIQRGLASAERVFAIVDIEPAIADKTDSAEIKTFEKDIRFENVSFAYVEDKVLKNISLTIEKGKTIALVGPSGGGKSTLADLIPRFWDVQNGAVKIDGRDVRDIRIESLRQQMGIVTQESILFNDTIFNNIAFGNPHATEEQVMEAAKIANAHDFIIQTENGYQTNIGERGSKLSGGQRQRLSIARAVLKNPPILILDEATSALDAESERLVQDALTRLMQNRTSIVIAHRLSTVQHADEIIVVRKGEIVERGKHSELIQLNGLYKKLYGFAQQQQGHH